MGRIHLSAVGVGYKFRNLPPVIPNVVVVGDAEENKHAAMIDTAAEFTEVPASVIKGLNLEPVPMKRVLLPKIIDGTKKMVPVPVYHIVIILCGREVTVNSGVEGDDSFFRLGRDVLIGYNLFLSWVDENLRRLESAR